MTKRLASPHTQLAYHYDAVVVGSGYGAAISAARLAQAGFTVAVLERGREWVPGDFPSDETSVAKAVRSPLEPFGLFDGNVQLKNDLDVVVGNGLGGTSLINAGISLRPEAAVFEQPEWPTAIRKAWAEGKLAAYYDRGRRCSAPTRRRARIDAQGRAAPGAVGARRAAAR